ncbi:isochorismatase family protein [Patescibacteria group bacterium]
MTKKIKIVSGEGNALIVIDGNRDFTDPDGALYVEGVDGEASTMDIISRIRLLSYPRPFDYLATTEDKHPKNHIEHAIFGPHCVKGTWGQDIHGDLIDVYDKADEKLVKGEDPAIISYSISTSPQFAKHIAKLRKKFIKRIFLVGWAYTHCVGESAIAYAAQGFEVYVIRNATASVAPPYGDPEAMTKKLELYGVKLVNIEDIE